MRILYAAATLLVIITASLCAGCRDKAAQLEPLPADAVILAFGDSLTYGTGARPDQSYPATLQTLSNRRVVNAGVPGEVSATGLQRLPQALGEHNPNLVVIIHGGNDILRRMESAATAANLDRMIKLSHEHGAAVVLVGVPQPHLLLKSADYYAELAKEYKLPIDDEVLPDILGDRALKADTVHPNAAGYRVLAKAIHALLKRNGAL